ncbi:1100_t:CDS:2, partial [Paraglomus occultum]
SRTAMQFFSWTVLGIAIWKLKTLLYPRVHAGHQTVDDAGSAKWELSSCHQTVDSHDAILSAGLPSGGELS